MAKNTTGKGILMQGIGRALTKSVNAALYEYRQFFLSKKLGRNVHADALYYLLNIYSQELEKEKISPAKIQKILYFMYYSLDEYTKEPDIPIELYTDMKKVKIVFDAYKEKNEKFDNETIAGAVEAIDSFLTSLRPELTEEDISLAQKMKEKLDETTKQLEEKDKEIERLRKEFERFSKDLQKDNNYKEKYENAKKEINSLNEEIKRNEKKHSNELQEKENEIASLSFSTAIKDSKISELEKKISLHDRKEIRNDEVTKIIFDLLSNMPMSPEMIIKEIEKKGYFVSLDELQTLIKKSGLNVTKQAYNNHQFSYGFNKYPILNRKMNLGISHDISCLFISGLNITNNEVATYEKMEEIYNYCKEHEIHYIFILGNIIKLNTNEKVSYETLKKIENITNEFIKNYPKDSSINNIVLGGLNELTLSSVGYDLANIINTNRYDFNSIGNKDSIITINGGKVCINLHSYYYGNTFNYINNYYLQRNIDNPYNLDIMSFIGPSSVDITNRIITIPPLMSNDMGCSIYQIEISMQDGDYKRFLIQPIMNTELIPTSRLLLYK